MLLVVPGPRFETLFSVYHSSIVPSPSWPYLLSPAHFAEPSLSTMHIRAIPRQRLITAFKLPRSTAVGTVTFSLLVSSPS